MNSFDSTFAWVGGTIETTQSVRHRTYQPVSVAVGKMEYIGALMQSKELCMFHAVGTSPEYTLTAFNLSPLI